MTVVQESANLSTVRMFFRGMRSLDNTPVTFNPDTSLPTDRLAFFASAGIRCMQSREKGGRKNLIPDPQGSCHSTARQHGIYPYTFPRATIQCEIDQHGFATYQFVTLNNMIMHLSPSDESRQGSLSSQDIPPCCRRLVSKQAPEWGQSMVQEGRM